MYFLNLILYESLVFKDPLANKYTSQKEFTLYISTCTKLLLFWASWDEQVL